MTHGVTHGVTTVTTNNDKWQQMATGGTMSENYWYNKWQWVVQRVTTKDNNLEQMRTSKREWF